MQYDVIEVNMVTRKVSLMGAGKDERNAEAVLKFAMIRRGEGNVYHKIVPAGQFKDGDVYANGGEQ